MCGIAGILSNNQTFDDAILDSAIKVLHHRGPDDSGKYLNSNKNVGFIHTRLSFLDLSERGHQPMLDGSNNFVITYNGEIYNFKSLREELLRAGHSFSTETDTEVLLNGYKEWGEKLPEKLEGMFAFAIYDIAKQEVFLARDHFGIKPLFYHIGKGQFIFSSEIKGILQLNPNLKIIRKPSIALFLANRYIPTPYTIWENIFKLTPGHWLKLNIMTMKTSQSTYWKLKKSKNKKPQHINEEVSALMVESMKKHLVSDVEIGSFLSGGYDSSLLVYLMRKKLNYPVQAFAIGFENWEQSEHQYAQKVADELGIKLHVKSESSIDLELVKKLMWHYDDPIADISIIPTYEISKLASTVLKAVVSGEGADECHAGYWWNKPDKFIYKSQWHRFKSNFGSPTFTEIKHHYTQAMSMGIFNREELQLALTPNYASSIPIDPFQHFDQFEVQGEETTHQIQYLDIYTFMTELVLTKVDRASMAHSLEVRVPFLYKPLVEYLYNLNSNQYLKRGFQKPIIRALLKNNVPDEILDRPKQGFVGPDSYYMNFPLYEKTLLQGKLVSDNVIEPEYIKKILNHKDHWRLWKLFVLENWWQVWMS